MLFTLEIRKILKHVQRTKTYDSDPDHDPPTTDSNQEEH
jgi:hypothetical protein